MKIERSKNASRNIVYGIALKLYHMIVPFILRTVMIYVLGIEYVGLNSLFTSILSVLNLAELGVGSAMVYSMYEPIANNNKEKICSLMKLYRTYYRIIGLIILVAGLIILPFVPKLIKGTVPDNLNIYALYLINLLATVLTYWLFAYKNSLLNAHLRNDVISKISIIVSTFTYGIQIVVLFVTKNYYFYIIVLLLMNAVNNIVTSIIVDKMYPDYCAKGKLDKKEAKIINNKIKDLFTAKLGTIIIDSADSIVISAFLGLRLLAIYQNYFYIFTAIFGLVTIVMSSCTAGIGNSIIVETEKKNFNDLKKFTLLISWIAGFCCCCFACLYQPFMTLWVGEENLLDFGYVIAFCVYFYIKSINSLINLYKDAAGIWHEDRFRPLVTALSNLAMNLIMVQFWGLYGIILSTIISMLLVGMPWLYHNLFTVLFHISPKRYIIKMLFYLFVSSVSVVISIFICNFIDYSCVLTIVLRLIVCVVVPNILYFIVYFKTSEFRDLLVIVNTVTHSKIKFIGKLINKS